MKDNVRLSCGKCRNLHHDDTSAEVASFSPLPNVCKIQFPHPRKERKSRVRHAMLETRHTLYNNLLACAAVDEGQVGKVAKSQAGNLSAVRHNASTWASQTNTRHTAIVVCLRTTKQEMIAILRGKSEPVAEVK